MIIKNGTARQAKTVSVEKIGGGESLIRARFASVRKLGQWDVTIKYLGTQQLRAQPRVHRLHREAVTLSS